MQPIVMPLKGLQLEQLKSHDTTRTMVATIAKYDHIVVSLKNMKNSSFNQGSYLVMVITAVWVM